MSLQDSHVDDSILLEVATKEAALEEARQLAYVTYIRKNNDIRNIDSVKWEEDEEEVQELDFDSD